MDNNHVLIVGDSGSGKSSTVKSLIENIEDAVFVMFDSQVDGSGVDVANTVNKPRLHERLGGSKVLPMDLGTDCSDMQKNNIQVQLLRESIGAYRGMGETHTKVQIAEHFEPFALLKIETGLPFAQLQEEAWFGAARHLIQSVNNKKVLRWLSEAPKAGSANARERLPARRFASILCTPAIEARDVGFSNVAELINSKTNLVVTPDHNVTMDEFSFYMNFRLLEIIRLKMVGEIKESLVLICEETEIIGLAPMIAKFLMGVRKYDIAIWLIGQTGKWKDEEFETTEAIWANTNRIIHRCSSPLLLDRIVKDLAGLFDPYMVKEQRQSLRQVINGYELVDTESITKREKGQSVTESQRAQNIYHRYIESQNVYFSATEQSQLLKGAISRLKPGQAITKVGGEINFMRFPYREPETRFKDYEEDQWLTNVKKKSNNSAGSIVSRIPNLPSFVGNSSEVIKSQKRQFSVTSGHWSTVEISALSEWLWPEREQKDS